MTRTSGDSREAAATASPPRADASGPRSPPRRGRAGGDRRARRRPRPPVRVVPASLQYASAGAACLNAREGSRPAAGGPAGGAPAGEATSIATAAAPPSAARKPQGIARWSGGGSKTWVSMATSICASSQPSPAARQQRGAEHERRPRSTRTRRSRRSGAPIAAIVASSWRRSAIAMRDEQRHRRGGEHDREGLLDVADPGQVDGRDRAHGLRGLLVEVLDLGAVAAGGGRDLRRDRAAGRRSSSRTPRSAPARGSRDSR